MKIKVSLLALSLLAGFSIKVGAVPNGIVKYNSPEKKSEKIVKKSEADEEKRKYIEEFMNGCHVLQREYCPQLQCEASVRAEFEIVFNNAKACLENPDEFNEKHKKDVDLFIQGNENELDTFMDETKNKTDSFMNETKNQSDSFMKSNDNGFDSFMKGGSNQLDTVMSNDSSFLPSSDLKVDYCKNTLGWPSVYNNIRCSSFDGGRTYECSDNYGHRAKLEVGANNVIKRID